MKPNPWILLSGAALSLVMVFAMMECVVAFVGRNRKHRRRVATITRDALLARIEALNETHGSFRIRPSEHADLEVVFDPVDSAWRARFSRVKLTTVYRAKLVLDAERHEIRWFEFVRSSSVFIGFQGLWPRIRWSAWFQSGYIAARYSGRMYGILPGFPARIGDARPYRLDTVAIKRDIGAIAKAAGWAFKPKVWWFQVKRRADGTIPRGLIPSRTRYWSELQFWSVVYPLLYVLTLGCIVVGATGGHNLTWHSAWLPAIAMTAFWWTIWGAIMLIFWVITRPRTVRARPPSPDSCTPPRSSSRTEASP